MFTVWVSVEAFQCDKRVQAGLDCISGSGMPKA